jgi:integrase
MPAERRGARMLKADIEAVGIPYVDQGRYFDFHALRGMCATRLAKAGVPLTVAQRVMRHSDPKLTANFYNHFDMDTKVEAVSRLPSLNPRAGAESGDGDETPHS